MNNRIEMFTAKKYYKSLIRRKSASYKLNQRGKLKQLKTKNPKEFWKMLSPKEKAHQVKVAPGDFLSYFQDLCSRTGKDAYVTVQETQETNPTATAFPELDEPISSKEIVDAVKSLKNEKSSGYDNIINEMLSADVPTLEPV